MMVVFSLVICSFLRFAEIIQCGLIERQTYFLGNHLTASQDSNILQHRLATIAEARRFDCSNLDDPANVVDNQMSRALRLQRLQR